MECTVVMLMLTSQLPIDERFADVGHVDIEWDLHVFVCILYPSGCR